MERDTKALVIDDHEGTRFFVSETLKRAGYQVDAVPGGEQALDALRDTAYDLLIVDLKLGGRIDGLEILNAVRWRWPNAAVVILTGYASLDTALQAIREDVDLYLEKPIEADELVEAVQEALERRRNAGQAAQPVQTSVLDQNGIRIDLNRHEVWREEDPIELNLQEFKLLVALVENSHRVVDPKELVRVVRGYECDSLNEARQIIKWYVHRLRRKIEPDPDDPRYILNVRGVGYTLGASRSVPQR